MVKKLLAFCLFFIFIADAMQPPAPSTRNSVESSCQRGYTDDDILIMIEIYNTFAKSSVKATKLLFLGMMNVEIRELNNSKEGRRLLDSLDEIGKELKGYTAQDNFSEFCSCLLKNEKKIKQAIEKINAA